MTVESQHPEYRLHIATWERVRAACVGARAIKEGKSKFLPKPTTDSEDKGIQRDNDSRYKQYLERAQYTNFCGRTLTGLKGAAFRKPPEINLPAGLDYLIDNATGDGTGLEQLAKDQLTELLSVGREGYLVDYPMVEEGATAEQTKGIEARILPYAPECIINWKVGNVSGRVQLILVVLKEKYDDSDDEFECVENDQYRVLRLEDGAYTQQVYREGEPITPPIVIRQANGSRFDFIPFCFAGSINNDFTVDPAPMESMAEVNIGHYRNSADIEENSFIHGQLTLGVTSSLSQDQWEKANPDGIIVGSRAGHFLGEQGGFHSVQASPSSLTRELMRDKEQQMVMLGAQLITDKNQNQTAKAAQIQHASEHSVLGDVVGNLGDCLTKCVEWCGLFMGVQGEITLEINTNFFEDGAEPQMIMAAIQLYDREVVGLPDLRDYARKAGITERTDEEIEGDIEEIDPDMLPEEPKRARYDPMLKQVVAG